MENQETNKLARRDYDIRESVLKNGIILKRPLRLTGRIVKLYSEEVGLSNRNKWKKQSFVLKTLDENQANVFIAVWNDKINFSAFKPEDEVIVYINLQSYKYDTKWYTSVTAWKMSLKGMPDPDEW
ncbi:MAG: DUF3127 domain-containing protein [Bacteroidales bacterium]|nr:DUF3127 domain-containing protein [Bacteroidales bacterium]